MQDRWQRKFDDVTLKWKIWFSRSKKKKKKKKEKEKKAYLTTLLLLHVHRVAFSLQFKNSELFINFKEIAVQKLTCTSP